MFSSDPPTAPRWLNVVNMSRNSADLKWTAPERDGGSPVTNYVVEKRDARRKGWQTVDTTVKELAYTVTPLNEGSLYVFRVAAENAVGVGPFCELPDSVLAKDTFSEVPLLRAFTPSVSEGLALKEAFDVCFQRLPGRPTPSPSLP